MAPSGATPKLLFVCFAVDRDWLTANSDVAQCFAKAWLIAISRLYDPANRMDAQRYLAEALKLAPEIAVAA